MARRVPHHALHPPHRLTALIALASLLGSAFAAAPVCAAQEGLEPTLGLYRLSQGPDRQVYKLYIFSEANGLAWANTDLAAHGQPMLYCMPARLQLTPDQVISIVDRFVAGPITPEQDTLPVGRIVLAALRDTFPFQAAAMATQPPPPPPAPPPARRRAGRH